MRWLFVLGVACFVPLEGVASATGSFLNQPAPPLQVEQWLTPVPQTSGKFILLNFWATWCPACRQNIPRLNNFQSKYSEKLAVIGLSSEPEAAVRAQSNPHPVYFSAIDSLGRTSDAVGVNGIPHLLAIDPEGVVRWEGNSNSLDESKLLALMKSWKPSKAKLPGNVSSGAASGTSPPKKRVRFHLKDGTKVEGDWVGSFGKRSVIITGNGKQVEIHESQVTSREDLTPAHPK